MQKMLLIIVIVLLCFYILVCGFLYLFQEKLIFFPEKLSRDHQFSFSQQFQEYFIKTSDHKLLNGLLFKAGHPRGLIFYLHGNAGSLASWGDVAATYTSLDYDVFITDYRGFGKSEGSLISEEQFYEDMQIVYDTVKTIYPEDRIIVLGYSIGTGPATKLAATNNPGLLILQAPYYSLTDLSKHTYPFVPGFLLKYKFETCKYLKDCKMPVVLFHGKQDEVIYYGSSVKLKALFKPTDTLISLEGQSHNGMTGNPEYRTALRKLLAP